jgi:hypothetical protein
MSTPSGNIYDVDFVRPFHHEEKEPQSGMDDSSSKKDGSEIGPLRNDIMTKPRSFRVERNENRDVKVEQKATPLRKHVKAAIHELFVSGNMPRTQKYLLENSFFNESETSIDASDSERSYFVHIVYKIFISILFCVNVVLRGISQVYLCNNPISGLLICVGLAHVSDKLLVYALVGTICSTTIGSILTMPASTELAAGLCGYTYLLLIAHAAAAHLLTHYCLSLSGMTERLLGVLFTASLRPRTQSTSTATAAYSSL